MIRKCGISETNYYCNVMSEFTQGQIGQNCVCVYVRTGV